MERNFAYAGYHDDYEEEGVDGDRPGGWQPQTKERLSSKIAKLFAAGIFFFAAAGLILAIFLASRPDLTPAFKRYVDAGIAKVAGISAGEISAKRAMISKSLSKYLKK